MGAAGSGPCGVRFQPAQSVDATQALKSRRGLRTGTAMQIDATRTRGRVDRLLMALRLSPPDGSLYRNLSSG